MMIEVWTSSSMDLSQFDDQEIPLRFENIDNLPLTVEARGESARHRWHLSRWGGCSCNFRQAPIGVNYPTVYFGLTEEWQTEEPDEVVATQRVYEVIAMLVEQDASVECVQIWADESDSLDTVDVSLALVSKEEFRFAERVRYCFSR